MTTITLQGAVTDHTQEFAGPLTTGSFTPPSNCILVAFTSFEADNDDPGTGAVVTDSLGGTWTRRVTAKGGPTGAYIIDAAIFTREVGTASAMTVSLGHPTFASDACNLTVVSVDTYDTSAPTGGTGSLNDPIGSTGSHTLSAAPASEDVTLAARTYDDNGSNVSTATPGSGWTEIAENNNTGGFTCQETQYRLASTSTTVDWANTNDAAGTPFFTTAVSIVIKAPPAPGVPRDLAHNATHQTQMAS